MKNFTPLVKLTSRNINFMIFRHKKTYKINDIEFTKSDKISLYEYFKSIDFIAKFDKKNYNLKNNVEAQKKAKVISKMQPKAKEIFDSFGLNENYSNLALYKETLKLI